MQDMAGENLLGSYPQDQWNMTEDATLNNLQGELRHNEPMARHSAWRVGGVADRFYVPATLDDLTVFLSKLPDGEPLIWVGLGTNLLVREGGIRGTVVSPTGALQRIERIDRCAVWVEAGVGCPKVARFSAGEGLTGAEFLSGIPGTVGGALAMNAGAFGGQTWDIVDRVQTLDRRGRLRLRDVSEFTPGYRTVKGPADEWFVAAHFRLTRDETGRGDERIRALLAKRAKEQPLGQPSCGSVFRNPPGDFAARLIEVCGLKGACVGDACVSDKHANFIVNLGQATATDIEALMMRIRERVKERFAIELVPEVIILGETQST